MNNSIVEKLKNNGYEAYIVGGYVRDYLLGIDSRDIDICTNASIDEIKEIFKDAGKSYDKYFSYHYGYILDENGKRDFSKLLSSDEYKKLYQNDIDIFNKYINKTKIIVSMVDRFIVRGRNSNFDIDALICGTVDDYEWIMKYDIYDLVLS